MKLLAVRDKLPLISTPLSISLADHLTPEEREQLLQTIEMFETIVAAAPDDLSTLEILKEAYWKIGRLADAITTGQQLGAIYERLGQNPAAIREYESIHRQLIENADTPIPGNLSDTLVTELELKIAELREQMRGRSHGSPGSHSSHSGTAPIALDFGTEFDVAVGSPLPTSPVGTPSEESSQAQSQPQRASASSGNGGLSFPGAASLFQKESPTSTTSAAGTPATPATPATGTPASSLSLLSPGKEPSPPGAAPAPSVSMGGGIPFKLQTDAPGAPSAPAAPAPTDHTDTEHTGSTGAELLASNTLIATAATRHPNTALRVNQSVTLEGDGYDPLIKYLTQHNLVSAEILQNATEHARQFNQSPLHREGRAPAASVLLELEKAGVPIAPIVSALIDRTKFAYAPLDYYDIDRQIVRMLPESLTLNRLIVPFDIIGRTVMIAIDNPFDAAAKNAVQQSLDHPIQWHIALPQTIQKILCSVYRLQLPL